jgi:hypothetical protein
MCLAALQLTDRKKYIYDEADMAPAQFGLAYSYGQRDHTKREFPPFGTCGNRLYGLDCSGLIHQLFKSVGITRGLWGTANSLRTPDTLIKAIKYKYPDFDELKVEDMGNIPATKFQTGDIIYWMRPNEKGVLTVRHIGMVVLDTLRNLAVVQSNGVSQEWKTGDCVKNYSTERGPRIVPLANAVEPGVFGDTYGITRISVDIKPPDYNRCGTMVKVYGYYHEFTPTTSRDYESDNGAIQTNERYPGSFQENVFHCSYTRTVVTVKHSGQITAFFNKNYDVVELLCWYEDTTSPNFSQAKSFIVTNIHESLESDIFKEEGEESCAHIYTLQNVQTSPTGLNSNLKDHECTWKSTVYISFSKE